MIFIKFSNGMLIKHKFSKFSEILGISAFILFVVASLVYLSIFYINDITDNLVVSFTYYITYWFITYITAFIFDSFSLPSFVLDYVSTLIALVLVYLFIVSVIPKFMDYKNHEINKSQFIKSLAKNFI